MEGVVVVWLICAILGGVIGNSKGRAGLGVVLGLLLGLIGLIIIAVLPANPQAQAAAQFQQGMKRCPHCAEIIQGAASVCRFCGRDIPQPLAQEGTIIFQGREYTFGRSEGTAFCLACRRVAPAQDLLYHHGSDTYVHPSCAVRN
jgi:hypothetical protein